MVACAAMWAIAPAIAHAQFVGESVNMVSGIQWPGGDPFLQRQNEPSLAVSSANPQHLLAGANDYRSVDIPFVPGDDTHVAADAWLGVFKSYDAGQTWKSYLMPGYPQDKSAQGASSLMRWACGGTKSAVLCKSGKDASCQCNAAADPVVRAGTDGMFFFTGISFLREPGKTPSKGAVVLNRFIDLNSIEGGTPLAGTDSIQWLDATIIDQSDGTYFPDKPWVAVDVPRTIKGIAPVECSIADPTNPDPSAPPRKFLGGTIYVSWSRVYPGVGANPETADVFFRRSLNCGKDWEPIMKLNDATSLASQGAVLSVDPRTGDVYTAWRRFAYPATTTSAAQDDAIFAARTFSKGSKFTRPHLLTSIPSFDQDSSGTTFRSEALPSIASSVDPADPLNVSYTHVAWAQTGANGDGQVVVSLVPVKPPPPSGDEADDDCSGWKIPAIPIDASPITDDVGNSFSRGHQFMPQLTFSQGRLVAVWYDTRLDHTRTYYNPHLDSKSKLWTTNSLGRWYDEERGPVGDRATDKWTTPLAWVQPTSPGNVINDDKLTVRHTIEVRMAMATPAAAPSFGKSISLSRMPFGERGDEATNTTDPARDPADLYLRPFAFRAAAADGSKHIDLLDRPITPPWLPPIPADPSNPSPALARMQDLQSNPPNLPIFAHGTTPFIGDYIDVQGPMFVPIAGGGWAFNTAPSSAPVFHAVWTSNQDVVPPIVDLGGGNFGIDWTQYTPPGTLGGTPSQVDPTKTVPLCTTGSTTTLSTAGQTGSRNQNIYTARITDGLLVSSPQNAKYLGSSPSTFVVSAFNATSVDRSFTFTIFSDATGTARITGTNPVVIPARSSASQTVVMTLGSAPSNPAPVVVKVTEVGSSGTPLSASLTLNPAGVTFPLAALSGSGAAESLSVQVSAASLANASLANASLANASLVNASLANASLVNASLANASLANAGLVNASLANASLVNASLANASLANASLVNASLANASLANASLANASLANASLVNASLVNVNVANASLVNASLANASLANASLANASLTNASISDLSYTVTNTGSTSQAFDVGLLATPSATGSVQLIVSKPYGKPVAIGCDVREQPDNRIVVNAGVIDLKNTGSNPLASFPLAPGEVIQVTLRGALDIPGAVRLANNVVPVVTPQGSPTPPLVVTTTVGGNAIVGSPYNLDLVATGWTGTPTWICIKADLVTQDSSCSSLPPPLSIGPSTTGTGLAITGTPNTAGTYVFTVQATDKSVTQKTLTLVVQPSGTTTTLAPSDATPVYGEPVVLTATLAASLAPSSPPPGTVTFSELAADGTWTILTGATGDNSARKLALPSTLSLGTHTYKASYAGDANWIASSATTTVTVSAASTTTSLVITGGTSTSGTTTFGQQASFTATVTAGSPSTAAPAGTVAFSDGAKTLGTSPLANGTATYASSALDAGSHTILAVFAPANGNFTGSTSSSVTQLVNPSGTTLTVDAPVASSYGQPASFSASVTATAPGSGTPAGSVVFSDTTTSPPVWTSGAITTPTAGKYLASTSTLPGGSRTILVTFTPSSGNYSGSTGTVTQVVSRSTPTMTFPAGSGPYLYGPVSIVAQIASAGSAPATGAVTFQDALPGGVPVPSVTSNLSKDPSGNSASTVYTLSVPLSPGVPFAGTHAIAASYAGDGNYQAVTASSSVIITKAQATLSEVSSSQPSSTFGDPVTFTVHVLPVVTSVAIPIPTGDLVTFYSAANPQAPNLGQGALDSTGTSNFTPTSNLPVGTYKISAYYEGSINYASQGPTAGISQTVSLAPTTASLKSATASPSSPLAPVVLVCTIAPDPHVNPAAGLPLLPPVFLDGGVATSPTLTSAPVALGTDWTATFPSLAAGTHSFTCKYPGDAGFASSLLSATWTQVIQASTKTTLSASPSTFLDDKPITLTALVAGSSPTGTMVFQDVTGATPTTLGTVAVVSGKASLVVKSMSEGPHSVRAVYSGDAANSPSTSSVLMLKVYEDYSCKAYSKPLTTGGSLNSPSRSGTFTFGTKVAVKWQFVKPTGVYVSRTTAVKGLAAVFDSACNGKPATGAARIPLFDPATGVTAGSTFTYDATAKQYFLNWDTSKASRGCWDIVLTADNGIPQVATIVKLQ